jgi:glucose-6-phosphate 1-epimerase
MVDSTTTGHQEALVVLHTSAGDSALVSLHGAQVLSWQPARAGEQLYTSPLARPATGKAVRGGVPICFPQFSERGPLPKHGFVRNRRWQLVAAPATPAPVVEARFQLDSTMTIARWRHAFCLVLMVRLGPGWLELHLQAANAERTAYEFTAALHTYLAVPDVRTAQLHGLQGCTYQDNLAAQQEQRDDAPAVSFGQEIDRVYLQVPQPLQLEAGGTLRRIVQQGFGDVVVWNPGPEKAARLGDMPAGDWPRMLCVEAAAVGVPVQLAPGKTWRGMQRIELPHAAGFDLAQATPLAAA